MPLGIAEIPDFLVAILKKKQSISAFPPKLATPHPPGYCYRHVTGLQSAQKKKKKILNSDKAVIP